MPSPLPFDGERSVSASCADRTSETGGPRLVDCSCAGE